MTIMTYRCATVRMVKAAGDLHSPAAPLSGTVARCLCPHTHSSSNLLSVLSQDADNSMYYI